MLYVSIFWVAIFSVLDAFQLSILFAGKADAWTYIWLVSNTFLLILYLTQVIKIVAKDVKK